MSKQPFRAVTLPVGWPEKACDAAVQAMGIAHLALTQVRGWCADSRIARVRLAAKLERAEAEVALLREELRIKDARMTKLAPRERPHYAPPDRLAILQLRTARGWTLELTAARFLVTVVTLAAWSKRAAAGDRTLVQLPLPVNRFPDFVAQMVASLKTMLPTMGTRRIAQLLGRAGLAISASTVRRARMAQPVPESPPPATEGRGPGRSVKSTRRNQIWNVDLTTIATTGTTAPGRAGAVPPTRPFVWWIAVVLDQFSRRAIGFAVFDKQPTAKMVTKCLERAVKRVGSAPEATITDQGVQFRSAFKRWCKRHKIKPRFGAIGQHGSIAITERCIRSMKDECLRRILVPYDRRELCAELTRYFSWYNAFRPHQALDGATPIERWNGATPALVKAPFETRPKYPADGRRPNGAARCRGQPGARLEMKVSNLADSPLLQLPVIELRQAA